MGESKAGAVPGSGDFSIGSRVWPGVSKLLEEQGELIQVLGKLMATGGDTDHWSGDLRKMLVEEMGDVCAALAFVQCENLSVDEVRLVAERAEKKLALFNQWHANPTKPTNPTKPKPCPHCDGQHDAATHYRLARGERVP